jgi:hypothetical protein
MMHKTRPVPSKKGSQRKELPAAKLDELIEEATVDAYNECEPTTGFYAMLEENLGVPFKTEVLGVEVTVERIDMTDDEQIVAVCARDKSRERIPIADLPFRIRCPRARSGSTPIADGHAMGDDEQ